MKEKRRCPQCDGQGMIPVTVEALSKCPTCGGSGFLRMPDVPMTIEQRRKLVDKPNTLTRAAQISNLRKALAQTLRELDKERGRLDAVRRAMWAGQIAHLVGSWQGGYEPFMAETLTLIDDYLATHPQGEE